MACHNGADNVSVAVVPVGIGISEIIKHLAALTLVLFPDVAEHGVVVVGARIGDAVVYIIVRHVRVVTAEESELEDSHSGETAVFNQGFYLGGDVAQVLGNDEILFGVDHLLDRVNEGASGSLYPLAFSCCLGGGGNAPIGLNSAEMVYSHAVKHTEHMLDALLPPGKAVLFHFRPVVDGVAPELTVRGKIVGGNARDDGRVTVLVQKEHFAVCPYVRAIVGHVNGNVTDDGDSLVVCVLFDLRPLVKEGVLNKFPELIYAVVIFVGGPVQPAFLIVGFL